MTDRNVLTWMKNAAAKYGNKTAYSDENEKISFAEVARETKSLGSGILAAIESFGCEEQTFRTGTAVDVTPIVVISGRNIHTITAYLGVVYSGHCYAPVDGSLPEERIVSILSVCRPALVICDSEHMEKIRHICNDMKLNVVCLDELAGQYSGKSTASESSMSNDSFSCTTVTDGETGTVRTSSDPLYIIFTSGSSGVPKGVITGHESLMNYIEAYEEVMGITEEDILGNQSPLDYIAAIRDIYLPLLTGCSTFIIPKEYFMEPDKLFDCMTERHITAVGWSVSAFTVPVALGALRPEKEDDGSSSKEYNCESGNDESTQSIVRPEYLHKVCFSGSVMPSRVLRLWQKALPECRFVNQYGPTEATASCTYYPIDHVVSDDDVIPIGRPYKNYRVFLLSEDGGAVPVGAEGEICVGGPVLALGYYGDLERTAKDFVQNPLNKSFDERIYKTGDYGVMREDGILEFHGRKDRQIKHMGHRVELDEIEQAAMKCEEVKECSSQYNADKEVLYLFYAGSVTARDLIINLRESLPGFMVPRRVKLMEELPRLANGKIDMKVLKEMM